MCSRETILEYQRGPNFYDVRQDRNYTLELSESTAVSGTSDGLSPLIVFKERRPPVLSRTAIETYRESDPELHEKFLRWLNEEHSGTLGEAASKTIRDAVRTTSLPTLFPKVVQTLDGSWNTLTIRRGDNFIRLGWDTLPQEYAGIEALIKLISDTISRDRR